MKDALKVVLSSMTAKERADLERSIIKMSVANEAEVYP